MRDVNFLRAILGTGPRPVDAQDAHESQGPVTWHPFAPDEWRPSDAERARWVRNGRGR